jgi:hypothetical protein
MYIPLLRSLRSFLIPARAINIALLRSEDEMNENSDIEKSSISKARNPEEIADYWDSHSLANHWDQTHQVESTCELSDRVRSQLILKPMSG